MTLKLIKTQANAKTTEELYALLDGFKKLFDRAYEEKDLVVGLHAQESIEAITEVLVEREWVRA